MAEIKPPTAWSHPIIRIRYHSLVDGIVVREAPGEQHITRSNIALLNHRIHNLVIGLPAHRRRIPRGHLFVRNKKRSPVGRGDKIMHVRQVVQPLRSHGILELVTRIVHAEVAHVVVLHGGSVPVGKVVGPVVSLDI